MTFTNYNASQVLGYLLQCVCIDVSRLSIIM